jgi:predicted transposase/invertase (TIGR01784 family)
MLNPLNLRTMENHLEKEKGEKAMEVEYVGSKKEYWDNYSILTTSYNKGRAEGRAEGELNERLKNARSLKENGVAIDVIAKSIGLSLEEIENL